MVRKRKSWGSSVRSGSVVSGADGAAGLSSRSSIFGDLCLLGSIFNPLCVFARRSSAAEDPPKLGYQIRLD